MTRSQGITYHGNEKRVLISNEVELGMEIPTIKPQISRVSRDKGNWFRMLNCYIDHEVIVEYVGAVMDLQIPLMVIDGHHVCIFTNRRVTHLRFDAV